jgi:hypothetical protein
MDGFNSMSLSFAPQKIIQKIDFRSFVGQVVLLPFKASLLAKQQLYRFTGSANDLGSFKIVKNVANSVQTLTISVFIL